MEESRENFWQGPQEIKEQDIRDIVASYARGQISREGGLAIGSWRFLVDTDPKSLPKCERLSPSATFVL